MSHDANHDKDVLNGPGRALSHGVLALAKHLELYAAHLRQVADALAAVETKPPT